MTLHSEMSAQSQGADQTGASAPDAATSVSMRTMLTRGHWWLVVLAVLLASASITLSGFLTIRSETKLGADLTAQAISQELGPLIAGDDKAAITALLDDEGLRSGVERIDIDDANGSSIASWSRDPRVAERQGAGVFSPGAQSVLLGQGGQVLGHVTVLGQSGPLKRHVLIGLIIALCCLGITLIAARILARRLNVDVIAPLEHMGEIAHAVRSEREFGRRANVSGVTEIDSLARDFNGLLSELQGWHESLTSENRNLVKLAERDPLTGLGNRARFDRILQESFDKAKRETDRFTLLFLDCDGFKQVNDTFGHDVGDMVLCGISDRLQHAMREDDQLFRIGGDEFAVIAFGVDEDSEVQSISDRIRQAMEMPFTLALRRERVLGVSIGYAAYPAAGEDVRSLLREADRRMYEDKRARTKRAVNDV